MISAMIISTMLVGQCGPGGCGASVGAYYQSYNFHSQTFVPAPTPMAIQPPPAVGFGRMAYPTPYANAYVPPARGRFKQVFKTRFRLR